MSEKIYDVKTVFEMHNEGYEICETCEHGHPYYESDTGYSDVTCKGNYPADCQETIQNYLEENGECEDMKEENNNPTNEIKMNVDLESFKSSIVNSIKSELRAEIKKELKADIVKKIYLEVAEPQLEEMRTSVSFIVSEMLKSEIETYYNETKIQIGGGYGEEPEEYTVKQYTQKMIKESIEQGMVKKKSGYGSSNVSFKDYLLDNCIEPKIKDFMEKELKGVQKDVNKKVQNVFETKINTMMSEVALGVLKSNATYNDVTKKLLGE